jgi:hypothetical protein
MPSFSGAGYISLRRRGPRQGSMPFASSLPDSSNGGLAMILVRCTLVTTLMVALHAGCFFFFPNERKIIPLELTIQVLFTAFGDTWDPERSVSRDVFALTHGAVTALAYFLLDSNTIEVVAAALVVLNVFRWCRVGGFLALLLGVSAGYYEASLNATEDRGTSSERWALVLSYCLGHAVATAMRFNASLVEQQCRLLSSARKAPGLFARRLSLVNRYSTALVEFIHSFTHFVGLRTVMTALHWLTIMTIDWELHISIGAVALCIEMVVPSSRTWTGLFFPVVLGLFAAMCFIIPMALVSVVANGILSALVVLKIGNLFMGDVPTPRSTPVLLALWMYALYVDSTAQQKYAPEAMGFLKHKIAVGATAFGLLQLLWTCLDLVEHDLFDEIQQQAAAVAVPADVKNIAVLPNSTGASDRISADDPPDLLVDAQTDSVDEPPSSSASASSGVGDSAPQRDVHKTPPPLQVEKSSNDSGLRTGEPSDASEFPPLTSSALVAPANVVGAAKKNAGASRRKDESTWESPAPASATSSPPPDQNDKFTPSNESVATSDASTDGAAPSSQSAAHLTATMVKKNKKAAKDAEALRLRQEEEERAAEAERVRKATLAEGVAMAEAKRIQAEKEKEKEAAAAEAKRIQAEKEKEKEAIAAEAKRIQAEKEKEKEAKARAEAKTAKAEVEKAKAARSANPRGSGSTPAAGPAPPVAIASESPPPAPVKSSKSSKAKDAAAIAGVSSSVHSPQAASVTASKSSARPIMSIDGDEETIISSPAVKSPALVASSSPSKQLESPGKPHIRNIEATLAVASSAPPTVPGSTDQIEQQLKFLASGASAERANGYDDGPINLALLHLAMTGGNNTEHSEDVNPPLSRKPTAEEETRAGGTSIARSSSTLLDKLMELVKDPQPTVAPPQLHQQGSITSNSSGGSRSTPASVGHDDAGANVTAAPVASSHFTAGVPGRSRFTASPALSDASESEAWKVLSEELGSMVEQLEDDVPPPVQKSPMMASSAPQTSALPGSFAVTAQYSQSSAAADHFGVMAGFGPVPPAGVVPSPLPPVALQQYSIGPQQQVVSMQQIMTQQGPFALVTLVTGQQVACPIIYTPQAPASMASVGQQQQPQQPTGLVHGSYYVATPSPPLQHHQYNSNADIAGHMQRTTR